MERLHLDIFRPSSAPSRDIPLGARSVGRYDVDTEFKVDSKPKSFIQLFWSSAGSGAFEVEGVEHALPPEHATIYFPGMPHRYRSLSQGWRYRYWTLDGALAMPIVAAFGFSRAGVYKAGPPPDELFDKLEKAVQDNTPSGERLASSIAYSLLSAAANGQRRNGIMPDFAVEQAVDAIHKEWMKHELCVGSLADMLKIDRSVFSRRFHAAMGISPVCYIMNLRVQNALSLLRNGKSSVANTARACGWTDPNYFSRCIRKATGQSPEEFRKG